MITTNAIFDSKSITTKEKVLNSEFLYSWRDYVERSSHYALNFFLESEIVCWFYQINVS